MAFLKGDYGEKCCNKLSEKDAINMFDENKRKVEIETAKEVACEIVKVLQEKELKFSTAKLSLEFAKDCLGELKIKN